jgi:hypothetical protein
MARRVNPEAINSSREFAFEAFLSAQQSARQLTNQEISDVFVFIWSFHGLCYGATTG